MASLELILIARWLQDACGWNCRWLDIWTCQERDAVRSAFPGVFREWHDLTGKLLSLVPPPPPKKTYIYNYLENGISDRRLDCIQAAVAYLLQQWH